jgi:chromosomal replication initiation ATPase DnaA
MARQLAFTLPARAALGRHDFLVAPANETAVQTIEAWQTWPGRKLVLVGPQGSGKTHLAHVWATTSGAHILAAQEIKNTIARPIAPDTCIAVEDADRISDPDVELHLLGLHNLLQESGGWLLLTAETPVAKWPLSLPDLKSRLQAAGVARLDEPDDMLLSGVLLKLFDDRQLQIDPSVVSYIAPRIERSFSAAQAAVALIDREALAEKRAITRPFVAEILEKAGI